MTSLHRMSIGWLRANWFFLAAISLIVVDLAIVKAIGWASTPYLEVALLLDFAIVIPFLYLCCYWAKGRLTLIRSLALMCLAVWAIGHIVPAEDQHAVTALGWIRYAGLAVLTLLEIKIVAAFYRTVFTSDSSSHLAATKLVEDSGMPEWVANLIAFEAKLWRKLWNFLRRG